MTAAVELPVRRARSTWAVLWVVSLVLLFEPDLRSIGSLERVEPLSVGLVRGFWLSDLALLLPIAALVLTGRTRGLTRTPVARCAIAIWAYGCVIALVRHNAFSPFAYDLRIALAFVAGAALVLALPSQLRALAVAFAAFTLIAVCLSTLVVLALPSSATLIEFNERATAESAFLLAGPPLVLVAPTILIAAVLQDRRLITLGWLSAGLLFVEGVVLLQTRSLAVTVLVAIGAAWYGRRALTRSAGELLRQRRASGGAAVLALAGAAAVLAWRWSNVQSFWERMNSGVQLQSDTTWLIRAAEVVSVFSPMRPVDYLTGLGVGPPPPISTLGAPIFALHIGVLNVLWRFGAVIFVAMLVAIGTTVARWLRIARALRHHGHGTASDIAFVACAPAPIALAATAFISGGWSITPMLALGMSWAAFHVVADVLERRAQEIV